MKQPEQIRNCAHCTFWDLDGWGYSRPCAVWHGQFREGDSCCDSFQRDARFGGPEKEELKAFMDAAVGGR